MFDDLDSEDRIDRAFAMLDAEFATYDEATNAVETAETSDDRAEHVEVAVQAVASALELFGELRLLIDSSDDLERAGRLATMSQSYRHLLVVLLNAHHRRAEVNAESEQRELQRQGVLAMLQLAEAWYDDALERAAMCGASEVYIAAEVALNALPLVGELRALGADKEAREHQKRLIEMARVALGVQAALERGHA